MRASTPGQGVKDLADLFSRFEGRISRAVFWRAASLMFAGQIGLTVLIARVAGLGWRDFVYADRRALWVNLVVVAFFFWPSLALSVKRLHDRDLPGWWAGLLHVLLFIFYIDQAALRPILRDKAALLLSLVPVAMLFLIGAWLLIEMAFLSGTRGPNRFGLPPDDATAGRAVEPLADVQVAPRPGE